MFIIYQVYINTAFLFRISHFLLEIAFRLGCIFPLQQDFLNFNFESKGDCTLIFTASTNIVSSSTYLIFHLRSLFIIFAGLWKFFLKNLAVKEIISFEKRHVFAFLFQKYSRNEENFLYYVLRHSWKKMLLGFFIFEISF